MDTNLTLEEQKRIIVISAPSATGKTTIVQKLLESHHDKIHFSISTTTRPPRSTEVNNIDYIFISNDDFLQKKHDSYFIETAKVHNYYYGTSKQTVYNSVKKGFYCLLDIDIQGALNIKSLYPYAKFIFILPPSLDILKERLQKRAEHSLEDINLRLNNALYELSQIYHYNYYVVNRNIDSTTNALQNIIFEQ